jgi:cob(I)alamin adenosyltransferase
MSFDESYNSTVVTTYSCNSQPTSYTGARIKNGHCGTGDKMSSLFINGLRLPKSHKVFQIYAAQETLGNTVALFYHRYGCSLEKRDREIMDWFLSNLNALGSFCYWRGDKHEYAFPKSFLDALDERILDVFQPCLTDCKDFLIHSEERFILLDRCRIEVRKLEVSYAVWYEVLFGKQDPWGDLEIMAKILNRLSTYFFNLMRYEMKKSGVVERHWQGTVTPFR